MILLKQREKSVLGLLSQTMNFFLKEQATWQSYQLREKYLFPEPIEITIAFLWQCKSHTWYVIVQLMCISLIITMIKLHDPMIKYSHLVIKPNCCYLRSPWHFLYSSQGQTERGKGCLNHGFDWLPLFGDRFVYNTSFIHEISLIPRYLVWMLTTVNHSNVWTL